MKNILVEMVICPHAYLYSNKTGKVTVREGFVYKPNYIVHNNNNLIYFQLNDGSRIIQFNEPCRVYNDMVWLFENDVNKAIDCFITDKHLKIKSLNSKIDELKKDITNLYYNRRG